MRDLPGPHRSSSAEAQAVQQPALNLLAVELSGELRRSVVLQPGSVSLGGRAHCDPDGLDHSAQIVVEVYARQGRADFGAHVHKIARDALKLKLLTDGPLRGYRAILLFTSELAASSYLPTRHSWLATACSTYNIEVRWVALPETLVAAVERAQVRQDITRPLEA